MSITRSAAIGCLLLLTPSFCLQAFADDGPSYKSSKNTEYDHSGTFKNSNITDTCIVNGDYDSVYGAFAEHGVNGEKTIHTAEASLNKIQFLGSFKTDGLHGAYAEGRIPGSDNKISSVTNNNTIQVGSADASSDAQVLQLADGGYASLDSTEHEHSGNITINVTADNNNLDLYGGSYEAVAGGIVIVEVKSEDYTVDCANSVLSASNNTLTLHGGTYGAFEDTVFSTLGVTAGCVLPLDDQDYQSVSSTNNTLVLTYAPDGTKPTFTTGLVLSGGSIGTVDEEQDRINLQYTTGNTLKIIETKGMTAGNIKGFDNFEFQLPDNMTANETLLTLTDTAGTSIDGATVAVTKVVSLKGADGGEFQAGNKVYLLKNENGLSANNLTKKEVTGKTGVSLNYVLSIEEDDTSLYLVRAAGSDSTDEGTKAIAEGAAAGSALINAGADAVIAAVGSLGSFGSSQHASYSSAGSNGRASAGEETFGNIFAFGYAQGSSLRHETGSSVNVSSVSLLAGLGSGFKTGAGNLAVGAFFEYGKGSYTTNNSFDSRADIDGDGNAWYMGGGIMARMNFVETGPGHFYVEGSAHMGSLHNEYDSNDLTDANGNVAKFDMDSPYYSLHGGLGYVWNFAEGHDLDIYGKYIWSRVQGTDDTLTTSDKFEYDDMDSNRIRLGVRYSYAGNARFSPYIGAAFEHEFSGSCDSRAFGHPVASPSFEGSSGMGELGLVMKPSEDLPLSVNLGVQGYVGQKQGISGNCLISYEF